MIFARDGQSDKAVAAALDRHDQRRQRDVPTISVLVGPVVASQRLFSHWADSRSRPMVNVRLEEPNPGAVVGSWLDELAGKHDLRAAAVEWLAQRLNRNAGAVERSLRLMTSHELGMFFKSCLPLASGTSVELVGRRLIECAVMGTEPVGSDLAASLDGLLQGRGRPWFRLYRVIGELVDRNCLPVLVVSLAKPGVAGLEEIARLLAEVAMTQPRAGLALMVGADLFDNFVALAPAWRAKALLLESIVTLNGDRLSIETEPMLPSHPAPESTCDALAAEKLESEIWDLEALQRSSDDNDEARSAAERYLFERLEVMDTILVAIAFRRAAAIYLGATP